MVISVVEVVVEESGIRNQRPDVRTFTATRTEMLYACKTVHAELLSLYCCSIIAAKYASAEKPSKVEKYTYPILTLRMSHIAFPLKKLLPT